MYTNPWLIIPLYIAVAFIFFMIGLIVSRKSEDDIKTRQLRVYENMHKPMVPRILKNKNGIEYHACRMCNRRIWKPQKYCPYCSQAIDWNFIREYFTK